jgi:hypothetical protein
LQFWLRWSIFNRRGRFRITIFGEPTRELRQNTNLSVGGGDEDYVERVVVSLGLEERASQSLRRAVGNRNRRAAHQRRSH